jgi:excisionase family DNA binding protein
MDESTWLSLSEAAKQLGVHFTTLRRWADQGLVEHIRTPGGKRMFSPKSLDEFLERHRSTVQNPNAIEILKDRTLFHTRQDIQSHALAGKSWYLQLSDEQRQSMRTTGNRLIALMFQYCARETEGDVFLQEGERIAKEYGRFSYSSGLTLDECIRTFLFFRRSMLNSVHETGSLQGLADMDSQRLFRRMNHFLDEVMVGMVVEYNQVQ